MRVLITVGTRPELIKLWPVYLRAKQRNDQVTLALTGQHTDLVDDLLPVLGVDPQDVWRLKPAPCCPPLEYSGLLGWYAYQIQRYAEEHRPDYVIVQGDTNSALGGAMGGFYAKVPVVHVEAGLRTYDRNSPWPEEVNRQVISRFAALHFCPTARDARNLQRERIPGSRCFVTGNTVIDALLQASDIPVPVHPVAAAAQAMGRRLVLATIHRHENRGRNVQVVVEALLDAQEIYAMQVVWLAHPHPEIQAALAPYREKLMVCDPLPYPAMVNLLRQVDLVVTDSGGLQEECHYLNTPLIVCREHTERPCPGVSRVTALSSGPIRDRIGYQLARTRRPKGPGLRFGDGHAAERILNLLRAT